MSTHSSLRCFSSSYRRLIRIFFTLLVIGCLDLAGVLHASAEAYWFETVPPAAEVSVLMDSPSVERLSTESAAESAHLVDTARSQNTRSKSIRCSDAVRLEGYDWVDLLRASLNLQSERQPRRRCP